MKQSSKKGRKNRIGAYGEQITCAYLRRKGFDIIDTNYLKKWGEIDVVARETTNSQISIRFVEVKTVSYGTRQQLQDSISRDTHRPEENVTQHKLRKLHRAIESWLLEHQYYGEWQIDVAAVRCVSQETYATMTYIENVI